MCRTISSVVWIAVLLLVIPSLLRSQTQRQSDPLAATDSNIIFKVGGAVSAPRVIYNPDAAYSGDARNARLSGTCVLSVVVDPKGLPRDIAVKKSVGSELDQQAVEVVRHWRFDPALKDGVPVSVQIMIQVDVRLYGNPHPPNYQTLVVSADAGDAKSQFELSQLFLSDRADMKGQTRGLAYLEKSAQQGFPKAQFAMGEYLSSHGSDFATAYVWYARAEKNHVKHSDQKIKDLAGKMTPSQLSEAQTRVESKDP